MHFIFLLFSLVTFPLWLENILFSVSFGSLSYFSMCVLWVPTDVPLLCRVGNDLTCSFYCLSPGLPGFLRSTGNVRLQSFTSPSNAAEGLNIHGRSSSTGLWVCELCSTPFTLRNNLTRHKWKCEGTRQIACPDCGKKFYRRDNLTEHRMKWHFKCFKWWVASVLHVFEKKMILKGLLEEFAFLIIC